MQKHIFTTLIFLFISISSTQAQVLSSQSLKSDSKKLFLEGTKTLSTIKNPQEKSYYTSILKSQKSVISEFILSTNRVYSKKSSASFLKKQKEDKEFYENFLKDLYTKTLAEIHAGKFSATIDPVAKKEIISTTISYQKEFVVEALEKIQKYISSDILYTGNTSFSYVGSGGFLRINVTDYAVTNSIVRDEQETNIKISIDTDMNLPGKINCDYNKDYEYICKNGGQNHIAMNGAIELNYKKIKDVNYIRIKDISLVPTSLSGSEADALNDALTDIRKYTVGKTYSYSDSTFETKSGSESMMMGYKILTLLTEKSIFIPYAKSGDDYLMIVNPEFETSLMQILGEKNTKHKKTEFLFPELRYNNGTFRLDSMDSDKTIYSLSLGKDQKNITTFQADIRQIGTNNSLSGTIQTKAWNLGINIPAAVELHSYWDGYNTDTTITGSGVESLSDILSGENSSSGSTVIVKKIQISGTLSKESTNLSLLINTTPTGLFQFVKSGSSTNFMSWFNFGKNRVDISGKESEKFGTFEISTPTELSTISGTGKEDFSDIIDKITSILF